MEWGQIYDSPRSADSQPRCSGPEVGGICAVQALLTGAQQLLEGDSKHAADEAAVDSEGSGLYGGGERAAQVGNEVRDLLRIDEPFNE